MAIALIDAGRQQRRGRVPFRYVILMGKDSSCGEQPPSADPHRRQPEGPLSGQEREAHRRVRRRFERQRLTGLADLPAKQALEH